MIILRFPAAIKIIGWQCIRKERQGTGPRLAPDHALAGEWIEPRVIARENRVA